MSAGKDTTWFRSIREIPEKHWREPHPFLRRGYLQSVEECCSQQVETRYAVRFRDQRPTAGALVHYLKLSRSSLFPSLDEQHPVAAFLRDSPPLSAVVCGSLLAAGPHGFWSDGRLGGDELVAWMVSLTRSLREQCALADETTLLVLKDLPGPLPAAGPSDFHGFERWEDSPAMSLSVSADWRSMDDYVKRLRAPYRREYRHARQRLEGIERRFLSPEEITSRGERINQLYSQVLQHSDFVPARKDAACLASLVQRIPEHCAVLGYFEGDRLLAFNTRFWCASDFESHYFGMDYEANLQRSLYRNILYDDIAAAIDKGCSRLHFGRCSEESKSAMGAQAQPLTSLVHSDCPDLTRLVLASAQALSATRWPLRRPFKISSNTSSDLAALSAS